MKSFGPLHSRILAALPERASIREVRMFGGLSFMVNDRMVVALNKDGDLLVRVDPGRSDDLLARPGARQAEMGRGRSMGPGWITVGAETLTDSALEFWIGVGLDYHASAGGR